MPLPTAVYPRPWHRVPPGPRKTLAHPGPGEGLPPGHCLCPDRPQRQTCPMRPRVLALGGVITGEAALGSVLQPHQPLEALDLLPFTSPSWEDFGPFSLVNPSCSFRTQLSYHLRDVAPLVADLPRVGVATSRHPSSLTRGVTGACT